MASTQTAKFQGKVGSYAISTVSFDTWTAPPASQTQAKPRKTRGTKEVVHKIFAECASVIQDPFWIDKFTAASFGKLPSKFSFHDNTLSYRKGAKTLSVEISMNPYESAITCMDFFRAHASIFSPMDEQNSREMQYARTQSELEREPLTWADANKKMQDCLVSLYVVEMKGRMGLSNTEVEQLRQTIKLGISTKHFSKNNIHLEDNNIYTIQGLLWNPDKRIFYIDSNSKPAAARSYARKKASSSAVDPGEKDMIPQFTVKWLKYLDAFEKKLLQHARRQRRIVIVNNAGVVPRKMQLVLTTDARTTTLNTSDTSQTTTRDDEATDETYTDEDREE